MIIAVFSDIHGNVDSLIAALKIMKKIKPDQYLFLGDMAGYFYYQNEAIQLLNNIPNIISLKGNHDEYFIKTLSDKNLLAKLDHKYGQSYSILNKNITKGSLSFFSNLKDCEINEHYEAYHGSPHNFIEGYVYKDTKIQLNTEVPYMFLGHTHHPMVRQIGSTTIVNPGSIGQPRDHNLGSFAIVDLQSKKIEHIRYNYSKVRLKNEIERLQDNEYLVTILNREMK